MVDTGGPRERKRMLALLVSSGVGLKRRARRALRGALGDGVGRQALRSVDGRVWWGCGLRVEASVNTCRLGLGTRQTGTCLDAWLVSKRVCVRTDDEQVAGAGQLLAVAGRAVRRGRQRRAQSRARSRSATATLRCAVAAAGVEALLLQVLKCSASPIIQSPAAGLSLRQACQGTHGPCVLHLPSS